MSVLPFFGPAAHARKLPVRVDLRLIQTTDLHGHVLSYDYLGDRASDGVGLARLAHLIRAARAGAANSLLMDTGDALTGSALGDLMGAAGSACHGPGPEIHPMIAAMNYLGHDAATLGNHDFNFGLDPLLQCLAAARFPILCANVATHPGQSPCDDRGLLPPWSILSRRVTDRDGMDHELRIGVIGLVPPQIDQWDRHHLDGRVWTRDIVEAATAHLPALRAAGADLVIALCHSGIAAGPARQRQENAALQVAALPGVDVLLCGHQHQLFPGPAFEGIAGVNVRAGTLHGKPAVMAGFWGAHLGVIDLELTLAADGWRMAGHRSTIWPAGTARDRRDSGDDPAIVALAQPAHARTLARLRRSVGHSKAPVHSYFALVADDPSIQLVAEAQRQRVADLLAGTAEAGLPLLSAVAPFKAGGAAGPAYYTNLPAGPLSIGSLSDLYLFPNVLRAVRVSGATLLDWLEHAAGQFNRLCPGKPDQILRNPQFPSYNFDVICGLRYVIDPTQPARFSPEGQLQDAGARRISQVTCDGRPVQGCDEFIVATNSFRVDGGGSFAAARQMHSVRLQGQADQTIPEVLLAYIRQRGKFTPRTRPVWRFAPSPGTSALFDSAPAAADVLADVHGPRIERAGHGPGGFARFRLHF